MCVCLVRWFCSVDFKSIKVFASLVLIESSSSAREHAHLCVCVCGGGRCGESGLKGLGVGL